MTTYTVATTDRPQVWCPSWCVVPTAEHVDDLKDWDGMVLHWSSERELVPGFVVRAASTNTPFGDEDKDEPMTIHVDDVPEMLTPAVAARAAAALAALAQEVGGVQ